MTIDSAYQLELYNPDNDREYFFEFESTGATTFVLWVDYVFDGVAYRDAPGTFAYEIEFEGRGPIYKRGKITLTDDFFTALAGAKITRLTMQRKTPIYKDVTFEANGAWSSEGFEFEIDKICLIQQEIEGHYCDCREQEQGLDPIENVVEEEYYEQFPECEPYTCDAFAEYLVSIGVTPVLTYQANTDPWVFPFTSADPITAYANFTAAPSASSSWTALADKASTLGWPAAGSSNLVFCDGAIQQAVITEPPNSGDKAFLGTGIPGDGGYAAVITGWNGTETLSGELFRGPGKRYQINGAGAGRYFSPLGTIGIYPLGNGEHELRLFINGGDNGNSSVNVPLGRVVDKWILVTGSISAGEPVVFIDGNSKAFSCNISIEARANGQTAQLSHQYLDSGFYIGYDISLSPVANTLYSQRRLFYQSQLSFAAVGEWVAPELDLLALEQQFFRNFTDYIPPEYCIFPQG